LRSAANKYLSNLEPKVEGLSWLENIDINVTPRVFQDSGELGGMEEMLKQQELKLRKTGKCECVIVITP
jgi:hypothetical protein